jgi:hypothetical protein
LVFARSILFLPLNSLIYAIPDHNTHHIRADRRRAFLLILGFRITLWQTSSSIIQNSQEYVRSGPADASANPRRASHVSASQEAVLPQPNLLYIFLRSLGSYSSQR